MREKITIDGYEFPKASRYNVEADATETDHLNIFLEKQFGKFEIKDFMSRRHPDLFPGHIGLRSDDNHRLIVVVWKKGFLNDEGELENSWYCSRSKDPAKYIADILEFYKKNDFDFFNFIKDRIIV